MSASILVVDDDAEMADTIAENLASKGFRAECAVGGKAALALLKKRDFDLVITDLRMPDVDGLDVLEAARADHPARPVLIMTAFGTIDGALAAIRRGAFHYLTKPFKLDEALVWIERALADGVLRRENQQLRKLVDERLGFRNLIGKSQVMLDLYDLLERISPTSYPVLITGESGTGKDLVAQALHFGGPRARGPFIAVNCASLTETLLESELFGHHKGAFTGAVAAKKGLFVEAEGGTLFLDEIGEMPPALQASLLRAIETSAIRPVGGGAERKVDVRLIAASNRDLLRAVHDKTFREDLYYRLQVIPIALPPLRTRREDIPLLVKHVSEQFARRNPDTPARPFSSDALQRLIELPWPGNVRELKNVVERLLLLARGKRVELRDVAQCVPEPLPDEMASLAGKIVPLRVMSRRYLEWVLEQNDGNKVRTAELLGIDASTIYRMLSRDEDGE